MEKKPHWKTLQKLAKEGSVDSIEAQKSDKDKWTVVWIENGVDREFTYFSETPEAEEKAYKLALKKKGKVI